MDNFPLVSIITVVFNNKKWFQSVYEEADNHYFIDGKVEPESTILDSCYTFEGLNELESILNKILSKSFNRNSNKLLSEDVTYNFGSVNETVGNELIKAVNIK